MKLSTLLLSSAALVVAGSAYAADLPAKKAAPAAATGCPAFGAGFFQIPGGDTCIKFSGHARYLGSYTTDSTDTKTAAYSQGGRLQLETDVRSNTEIGTLRGFSRLRADSAGAKGNKYYVQFAGLTAGKKGSIIDFAGTNAENYGAHLGSNATELGLNYDLPLGASTLSFGLENAEDNDQNNTGVGGNAFAGGVSDRPDLLIGFASKAGPADIKIAFASHEAVDASDASTSTSSQGYAGLARIGFALGNGFGAAAFGGISEAASKFTTKGNLSDLSGSEKAKGSNFGGEITFATGSGTLAIAADQSEEKLAGSKSKVTNYGVSYVYNATKNLAIEPEFVSETTDTDGTKTTSNTVYLRIQRDF